jgi:hypothetical protein
MLKMSDVKKKESCTYFAQVLEVQELVDDEHIWD